MVSGNLGETILVIDDTPTNLEVLYSALSSAGYDILVEMDGESGLEQAQNSRPDLILLDVMMPGIDGFETCHRLKANPATSNIPVIFMTALSETENKIRGLNAGAVDYITKPFQHEEVLARVKIHLQIRSMTITLEEKNNLLKNFSAHLEAKIAERTTELQQAHAQLIQQERLSSLGQLVAGVAHEINNPVNFIYGNCTPANQYTQDLLELVKLYQEEYPQSNSRLQKKVNDIDLEFLAKDFPKVISSMQIGADRIREIVASLRNFSRLDEADFKEVDLHEGIDNTLMILHHRLKANVEQAEIQIIKGYGQIPKVSCFPGQLNQVFMNIIGNAIDALQEQDTTRSPEELKDDPSKIWIETQSIDSERVAIQISDNGAGIPEAVRHKLFNPFFTTKPVGKGTGLGLSISYQIVVKKHNGKIECDSTPGKGTRFIIEIPVEQTDMPS
ncbi:MAG: response regulator [Timaviella obliquedivisa GSE-PSE-MK23-08B]|jgi:signal transduction histidine kinase|nr:response regulator [Timaviella obliquedivisa GSE-PSE-MK23-08B]